jgi:hypothetical protein
VRGSFYCVSSTRGHSPSGVERAESDCAKLGGERAHWLNDACPSPLEANVVWQSSSPESIASMLPQMLASEAQRFPAKKAQEMVLHFDPAAYDKLRKTYESYRA